MRAAALECTPYHIRVNCNATRKAQRRAKQDRNAKIAKKRIGRKENFNRKPPAGAHSWELAS